MSSDRLRFASVAAVAAIVLALAALAACGGNPAGPGGGGVVVRGTVQGASALGFASVHAGAAVVTVTVAEDPAITTTVGADGSFTLRGLPEGGFTLIFSSGGTELGRLSYSEVQANQEITVTVKVSASGVVLLEEQRNGIGHGDVEIEGNVAQVIALVAAGDSRFLIDGKTVVARPGETAVREGNRSRNIEDITEGRRVHVKGTWLPLEGSMQPVLAQEIVLQSDDSEVDPGAGAGKACAAGTQAEVEGLITAKASSVLTVNQQGKGDFACEVSASTRIRKGSTTYTMSQLQPGWRVHVSGSTLGLTGGVCHVAADEVKVQ